MFKFLKENVSIQKEKVKMVAFLMLSIFSMGIDVLITYLNGNFIDLIVIKDDVSQLLKYSGILICGYVMSIILNYGYQVLSSILREELSFNLSSKLIKHLHHVPLLEVKKYEASYLTQRVYSDSSDIINFVLDNVVMVLVNVVIGASLLIYVATTNIKIFIVFICFFPIYVLIYLYSGNKLARKTKKVRESQNVFYQRMYEQINLVENIKTEANFSEHSDYLKETYNGYIKHFFKYIKMNTGVKSMENLLSYAFYAILLILGVQEIVSGNLTIGGFTIINAYFNKMISIITYYLEVGKGLKQIDVSLERMRELFDIEVEHNGDMILDQISEIKVKDLSYSYPDSSEKIFKNANYTFEKGNIYIIRGTNGKGKSTLSKIVMGIINVPQNVYYNGYPVDQLNMYDLRKNLISVLRQKIQFPYETIGKLLGQGNIKKADNEEFEKKIDALFFGEQFNLREHWNSYPDGLSGGELQKAYLHKVLHKGGDVLLLDEPTSALDEQSTHVFFELLQEMKRNKIIIVITHNPEFEKIADRVLYL